MNDPRVPEEERVAYCQNCGRPLTSADARNVGTAIFCEPCLVAKVAAADAPAAAGGYVGGAGGNVAGGAYPAGTTMPPIARVSSAPNPVLAALLGFIPGVGAFYNGQYAKGVVHLVVFAILTSLADHGNGIFGLFVAGWIFYQVIEAHHTARARRDGTPLPNPFGLNDIGERMGFGRAWPGGAPQTGAATGGVPPAGFNGYAAGSEAAAAGGAYVPPPPPPAYPPPPQANYGGGGYGAPTPSWDVPWENYANVPPPNAPDIPYAGGTDFSSAAGQRSWNRVPVGAVVLIVLGVLFLIGNSGWFNGFPIEKLIPFLLIGVGVWIFIRKMMETGGGLTDDGTPAYRLRLFRAARGPIWIVLVGVLFFLDTFNLLSWGRSWPLFIIVGGLVTFFERTAYAGVLPPPYVYPPPAGATAPTSPSGSPDAGTRSAAASVSPTSIVPSSTHDREGN